jgi:hypothetical protein
MRKTYKPIVALLHTTGISLGILFAFSPVTLAASVQVTSPNGGECLKAGSTETITWAGSDNDHYAVYFSSDGSTPTWPSTTGMISHPVNTTSYSWTIPSTTTSNGKITIEGHDSNHGGIVSDSSNSAFSIDTAPTAPTLQADHTTRQVDLTWTASTDNGCKSLSGYKVYRGSTLLTTLDANTRSYTDTTVNTNTTYTYHVEAYDDFFTTSSNKLSVVPGATPTPSASASPRTTPTPKASASPSPTPNVITDPRPVISKLRAIGLGPTEATITWQTNKSASSYLEYGESSTFGQSSFDKRLLQNHVMKIKDLAPGKTYYYRVKSKDANGNEATSNTQTFKTPTSQTGPNAGNLIKPVLTKVIIGERTIDLASKQEIRFIIGEAIHLEGTATANSKVDIFTFNPESVDEVIVGTDGKWKYTIETTEFAPGAQRIALASLDDFGHTTTRNDVLTLTARQQTLAIGAPTPEQIRQRQRLMIILFGVTSVGGIAGELYRQRRYE